MRNNNQLSELIAGIPLNQPEPKADLTLGGITQNSQKVQPGDLFIAMPGLTQHGLAHLTEAIQRGAAAVIAETDAAWPAERIAALADSLPIPLHSSPALSQHLATLAQRYYADPAADLRIVGITGTNGKTSIAHNLAQAYEQLEPGSVGIIGTLGNGRLNAIHNTTHTTPDLISLYAELARQRDAGIRQVMMEVSSHALAQNRVAGIRFDTAIFTNLTRDHQDYHGSMAAYGAAKAKLFHTPGLSQAVIQADKPYGQQLIAQLASESKVAITTISTNNTTQLQRDQWIRANRIHTGPTGIQIDLATHVGTGQIHSQLHGRFNAENLLLALGELLTQQISLDQAIAALAHVKSAPGRMTHRGTAGQPQVIIDYAHTPDALEKVLQAAREHTQGRLISVFGCGGDRDTGKRPLMGAIAERHSDQVWITDDNPRTETNTEITEQILAGMRHPAKAHLEHNRAKAIASAIAEAQPDDIIVVAGKGHETYQHIGTQKIPFTDLEQVEIALQNY